MDVPKIPKNALINYCCKDCDYNTCNKFDFNRHISTDKHKKNANPQKSPNIYRCDCCDYNTSSAKEYNRHMATDKHKKNANPPKTPPNYRCDCCDYVTGNKKDYNKHIATDKHKKNENPQQKTQTPQKTLNTDIALESDNKVDMNRLVIEILNRQDTMNMMLIEKTFEIQQNVLDLAKQQNSMVQSTTSSNNTNSNNTNNTNNSNNNTNNQFNLQFFLNETCKDAMNIDEFVKSLQVTMEDFETTGKLGYVEGITRIILNRLNQIDTNKRPIHCTDIKRETVYIKNEDAWEKENQEKERLQKAVKHIARMNLSQLPRWQRENPASEVLDTKENNDYIKFSKAALGGNGDREEERFVNKIMKNVMKEVVVSKE